MIIIGSNGTKAEIMCAYISSKTRPSMVIRNGACLTSVAHFHSEEAMNTFVNVMAEILDVKIDEVKETSDE